MHVRDITVAAGPRCGTSLAALTLALLASPAVAQTSATPPSQADTSEIIVTAQRRAENIVDVPISITAFNGKDIEQNNIRNIEDYIQRTPNVDFTTGSFFGRQSRGVSIRGVSNIGGLQSSSIIYVDELPTLNGNPFTYDLERIEVLRGPQGTYFGRNSSGGAINITTRRPDREAAAGIVLGYANFDTATAKGFVNVPLADTLFARVTGEYERSDGFVRNIATNGVQPDIAEYSLRGQLRFLPNDRLTIDLQAAYNSSSQGLLQSLPTGAVDPNAVAIDGFIALAAIRAQVNGIAFPPALNFSSADLPLDVAGLGFYPSNTRRVDIDARERRKTTLQTYLGKVSWDIGGASLSSITGYQIDERDTVFDQDGTALAISEAQSVARSTQFTQEVRLSSTDNPRFHWTLGGFYAKTTRRAMTVTPIGALFQPILAGTIFSIANTNQRDDSIAAFAEVEWKPIERLTLTLGGRYTRDKFQVTPSSRTIDASIPDFDIFAPPGSLPPGYVPDPRDEQAFFANGLVLGPLVSQGTRRASFEDFSPRLAIGYAVSDRVSAYATVSKGYKGGGPQSDAFAIANGFGDIKAETVWNYEIGVKGTTPGGALYFSLSAFYLAWKDLQVFVSAPVNIGAATQRFVSVTTNAASASSRGFEAELTWKTPFEPLRLDAGVGYVDAHFDEFANATFDGPGGFINTQCTTFYPAGAGGSCNLSGAPLPLAPKWTVNLGAELRGDVGVGTEAFFRAELVHRARTFGGIADLAQGGAASVFPFARSAYTLVNFKAGATLGRFSVNAFVDNAFDKEYYTATVPGFFLGGYRVTPNPRTYGLTLGVTF